MARKRKKESAAVAVFKALMLVVAAAILLNYYRMQGLQESRSEEPVTASSATAGTTPPAAEPTAEKPRYEIPVWTVPREGVILERRTYTLSFNAEENIPDWVAWRLDPDRLVERESRSDKFTPDPDLDPSVAVVTGDYTGSGWDRGHMCPAADNRWHWRAMDESFYMTNICPQHHNLNRGDWKELEDACRRWAEREAIYIVCGPILYSKPTHGYIGRDHRIRVPDAFFKVVLRGVESGEPYAAGFVYKNTSGNRHTDAYINTVDDVERMTGLDFFPALPDDVEKRVESQYKLYLWQ